MLLWQVKLALLLETRAGVAREELGPVRNQVLLHRVRLFSLRVRGDLKTRPRFVMVDNSVRNCVVGKGGRVGGGAGG